MAGHAQAQPSITVEPLNQAIDLSALHSDDAARFPALLQSTAHGPRGQQDMLFGDVDEVLLWRDGHVVDEHGQHIGDNFFAALQARLDAERVPSSDDDIDTLVGGWVVLLAYEAAAWIEPSLALPAAQDGLPTALALRCQSVIQRQRADGGRSATLRYATSTQRPAPRFQSPAEIEQNVSSHVDVRITPPDDARYIQQAQRALSYINAGDVFQVNLAHAWRAELNTPLAHGQLFRALRHANPAPFAAWLRWDGVELISSSPERLVSIQGKRVETRPIAGTRPRMPEADVEALRNELRQHPKERAEHIMLIDLMRNDLGRIAATGSVRVDALLDVEDYAHVHHIESTVSATLNDDQTATDVLRAVFPGGTITGCPKVRCMEIIAELEGVGRGAYTGSLGYITRDGRMDMNILIRTITQRDQTLQFWAGAGIVYDSIPDKEAAETHAKAKGMLRALQVLCSGQRQGED